LILKPNPWQDFICFFGPLDVKYLKVILKNKEIEEKMEKCMEKVNEMEQGIEGCQ